MSEGKLQPTPSGKDQPARTPVHIKGPTFLQNLTYGFSVFLVLLCCGLNITYFGEIIEGTTKHGVASQLGLMFFLSGLAFIGWRSIQRRMKETRALQELKEEQLIMNRARTYSGVLFISETALDCQLSISGTKKAFERLSLLGVCRVDVTDDGELCYRFPSLKTKDRNEEEQILGIELEPAKIKLSQEKLEA